MPDTIRVCKEKVVWVAGSDRHWLPGLLSQKPNSSQLAALIYTNFVHYALMIGFTAYTLYFDRPGSDHATNEPKGEGDV